MKDKSQFEDEVREGMFAVGFTQVFICIGVNALTPVAPMSYFLFDFDKLKQFLLVPHPFISHTAWRDLDGIK